MATTNRYTFLTSESFIRSNANINDEVHGKYLQSAMREAQEINLQSVLGTRLLRKLQQLVRTNTVDNEGNEAYKECIDQAQFYLLYLVVARLVMITGVHISNFGPNQPTDENMSSLYMQDLGKIEQYYIDKADFFCMMLQNWLLENHADLPELTPNKVSQLHTNLYSAASCGLWLGGVRGKGWRRLRNLYRIGYDYPLN